MPNIFRQFSSEVRSLLKRQVALEEFREALLPYSLFLLLILCSALLVTFAVMRGNQPVTIGAMIIAPLVYPFVGIALGMVTRQADIFWRSLGYALSGSILFVFTSFLVSRFYVLGNTDLLLAFLPPDVVLPEVVIALASGVVAAMAFASQKVFSRISGAVISLAMAPPLALIGMAIAQYDMSIVWLAGRLFLVNALGLVVMSTLIFYFFGFQDVQIKELRED